jgi:4-diphosphocytidyl-2-C-methyl-D-erythritol kinase
MTLTKKSPCKVNLLLNILGKRADGFHELETVFHPVNFFDELSFSREGQGIQLTCSAPTLPTDQGNLVYRAAVAFLETAGIHDGVRIHLEKRIPLAAGLGGGSADAATTLRGLNELFGNPLPNQTLHGIAAKLGSDLPFFLQDKPALATGRGETIKPLDFFPALRGTAFLLIYPGFGISTVWAYKEMARFPQELNGRLGRAQELIDLLQTASLAQASSHFYNSLEAPALLKYPILAIYQEFMKANGALAAMMSGSGSTTFAIAANVTAARELEDKFKAKYNPHWTAVVPV